MFTANEAKVAVNGDGFGIAWYGHFKEPGLFKHSTPAWSDGNLLNIARHIHSSDGQNILLASEPLQNDNTNWHGVQTDTLLSFSKTKDGSVVTENRSLLCEL